MLIVVNMHEFFRPHCSTTHIDAVSCCQPSSMVCLSVCHSNEPCKNGWTNRDAVWAEDSGRPKEARLRRESRSPIARGNFEVPIVKYTDCVHHVVSCAKMAELIKMSFGIWTWVGPSNYVLDGVHISACQGAIFRGRTCWACLTALCQELCKNGWTGRDAVWVVESDGPKDAYIRWGTQLNRPCAMAVQPFC